MAERKPVPAVIDLQGVTKTYGQGDTSVHALAGVTLKVQRGDFLAVVGASGSGKSTLMNIIGCLDEPTRGRYRLDGVPVRSLEEGQLSKIRNRKIGFIFQSFNLIARTTAVANVELPLAYQGRSRHDRRQAALTALERVGLSDRIDHLPNQLSGGQQQRVAVARAIATDPVLLLADEPTGALDSRATADVLALFDALSAAGRTIIIITHEDEVTDHAKRIVQMRDGLVVSDERIVALESPPPRWAGSSVAGAA